MWEWLSSAGAVSSLGVLLVGVAIVLAVAASVCIGVASIWMKPDRGAHALQVMGRLAQILAALRGKSPPTG